MIRDSESTELTAGGELSNLILIRVPDSELAEP